MGDIFEIILVIVGICVAVSSRNKKKKNAAAKNASVSQQVRSRLGEAAQTITAAQSRPAVVAPVVEGMSDNPSVMEVDEERRARLEKYGVLQEPSNASNEGAPGETWVEPPRVKSAQTPDKPLEVIRRYDPSCEECGSVYASAEHMREAVIMSEILNRPVALRPRRTIR